MPNTLKTCGLPTMSVFFPGSVEELQQFAEMLEKTAGGYGMDISCEKGKISLHAIKLRPPHNIWMSGKLLEEVDRSKCLDPHKPRMEHH